MGKEERGEVLLQEDGRAVFVFSGSFSLHLPVMGTGAGAESALDLSDLFAADAPLTSQPILA